MLYAVHEAAYYSATPVRLASQFARDFWSSPFNPAAASRLGRTLFAAADVTANMTRRYGKPAWGIDSVEVNGRPVRVHMETAWRSPWVKMRRFWRDPADLRAAGAVLDTPAVLVVAPLSGHYATLLRGTVQTFLQDHDVYVTDWLNARDVPIVEGRFDFNDYIDHVATMLREIGRRAHVVAVCQPGPPALAASALMAQDDDPLRPASITLMGSPIDARLAPTVTNILAEERPFSWFESNMIYSVPPPYGGAMRRVYPGFVQLYSFMSMNAEKHQEAHKRYFNHLVIGDGDSADKHREFYDEYLSVLDLTEEFYLQTVDVVFQRYLLAKGELDHRGRRVDLGAMRDIGVMTVEGEKDDISGVGQTQAAHALTPNVPDDRHELYVQPGVGHYGVFNGRRFAEEIYPRVRDFIARNEAVSAAP
ncbi:polyhydroxyalkanoate depolymerase [Caulobacter sp. KR2-114]|uniref:polyhydroxyalkanoate depolymerase n=1 Tax=Caulobacter sp. KR2-114 TaxID=3400912 RepID=UPI003C08A704